MSANGTDRFLNIEDANLRVRSGNVHAKGITVGGITVGASHGLQRVSDVSNTTSNTLQFTNATTSFRATSNIEVGGDVSYTSKPKISVESNVVTEYTGPHDRPLRKYPEVALTADAATASGYKGYKVTFSAQQDTNTRAAFRLFDHDTTDTNRWQSGPGTYNTSSPHAAILTNNLPRLTDVDGTNHDGQWVGLQLPVMIKLDHIKFTTYQAATHIYSPSNYVILGSNTGLDNSWNLLKEVTDQLYTTNKETVTVHVNATNKYKYYIWLIKNLGSTTGTSSSTVIVPELEYYGHEEGSGSLDTTLKTVYNVPATTGTQLEVYYDAKDLADGAVSTPVLGLGGTTINATVYGDPQVSGGAFVFDGTGDYIKTSALPSTFVDDAQHSFSTWFKLDTTTGSQTLFTIGNADGDNQLPHVVVQDGTLRYDFYNNSRTLLDLSLVPNQWYHLAITFSGGNHNSGTKFYINGMYDANVNSGGNNPNATLDIQASSPLTIGGRHNGTQLVAGSIANFRLYSKALNAGQVKELYDYQKDYFLGSKSQVTLYKGHLGVGVTEPSGQLELAGDERLQEYPPRGLTHSDGTATGSQTAGQTKNITYIEGHGEFKASASRWSVGTVGYDAQQPYNAFDKGTYGWVHYENAGYNNTTGAYEDNEYKLSASSGTPYGHWLKLEMPYTVNIKSYFLDGSGQNYSPHDWQIWASNDDNNWTHIHSYTGETYDASNGRYYTVSHTGHYKMFAIIVTSIHPGATLNGSATDRIWIREMKYFGTPGPTTLDKGSLSLTRSLDVPRISRYDVDTETPRPEKLVVDFDTTVNESPTDISGKGNHGAFYGDARYSPADKAFVFDGNGDYIQGTLNLNGSELDSSYTLSAWVKRSSTTNNESFLFYIGEDATGDSIGFYSDSETSYKLFHYNYSTASATSQPSILNTYRHIVATYDGTYRRIYIDGDMIDVTNTDASAPLGIPNNPTFSIGMRYTSLSDENEYLHGYMSNPKIYNAALEPSEVKKLYNLGRTGRSMVISDTAVGIGKVPEAQLDVRGSLRCDVVSDFLKIDHPGNQLSISRSDAYQNEFRWYAWSDGCNWFTPYTGKSIYIGRDGETLTEFNFHNVTTVKRGSSVISSSDDRLKRDEAFITNATDTLLKLKPQTYIKKHRLPENENDTDIPEQFEAGLIAQDVWYDAPEIRFLVHPCKDANPSETKPISPDPNDPTQDPDYSSWGTTQAYVNYEGFLPYLIKSNQEIYTELQAEKVRNDTLEARVTALEAYINDEEVSENAQIVLLQNVVFSLTKRIEALENA